MTHYIVWNHDKTEGFVTDDKQLAYQVRKSSESNCYDRNGNASIVGKSFCNAWGDEDCSMESFDIVTEEILRKPFASKSTLPMLYEAWERLPACEMLSVVGAAIQDLQYYQEELIRLKERHHFETLRMQAQIESLTKALTEIESTKRIIYQVENVT